MFNQNRLIVKSDKDDNYRFDEVYELLFDELVIFGLSITKNREDIEDGISDFFLKLLMDDKLFESLVKFKSYAFVGVKHRILNKINHKVIRKKYVEKNKVLIIDGINSIEDAIIDSEVKKDILIAFNALPNKCKEIFKLHIEGLSVQQIAEDLAVSVNTVKTQKKIALRILREKIPSDIFLFFV